MRSHSSAHAFIDHLFELLDDNTVDWDAARALGLLASEDPVLTKRNAAVLKVCKGNSVCEVYLKKDRIIPDSTRAKILQWSDAEVIRGSQGCQWYVNCT